MAFVRHKKVYFSYGIYTYQLVENYRENGTVKQRVLAHLGKHPTIEEAIAALEESIDSRREFPVHVLPERERHKYKRQTEREEAKLAMLKRLKGV